MTTPLVQSITDEQLAEIEAAADAFPDYEWDSNTEPFFNGPSGESLGGGQTGFYCVYGQPFEIDDEAYDGPTLVEACPLSQAKFICEAKPTIKALIARLRAAEIDAKRYRHWCLMVATEPSKMAKTISDCLSKEDLDAAIDAARGEV